MMLRFSEVGRHDVVDVSEAATLGKLDGLVVTPGPGRVTALRLAKATAGDVVAWEDLQAFGPDAATVASAAELTPLDETRRALADAERDLVGKLALNDKGDGLGIVTDAEFDPETGAITTVRTDRADLPGELLTGLGRYAAIFRDA
jgi:uncharacterized protein YrrD